MAGFFQQKLTADRTCAFIQPQVQQMLIIKSFTKDNFSSTHSCTLFSLQEGIYPGQQSLDTQTSHTSKRLWRENPGRQGCKYLSERMRRWAGRAFLQKKRRGRQQPGSLGCKHTASTSYQVFCSAVKKQNPSLTLMDRHLKSHKNKNIPVLHLKHRQKRSTKKFLQSGFCSFHITTH